MSSTLTPELETALIDQGILPQPANELVHLGQGRYYDPSLGRPLQPNPVGAPPSVPQALNRYAATSLGQPGVDASVLNTWNPFNDPNIGKSVGAIGLGLTTQSSYNALVGSATQSLVNRNLINRQYKYRWQTNIKRVPLNQTVDDITVGASVALAFAQERIGAPPNSLRARLFGWADDSITAAYARNSRLFTLRTIAGRKLTGYQIGRFGLSARKAVWLRGFSHEAGIGILLNVGYQIWSDEGNPYLTRRQKNVRYGAASVVATLSAIGGYSAGSAVAGSIAGPWGTVAGLVTGAVIGTSISIGLDVSIVPFVYEVGNLNPKRSLAPLRK